MSGSRMYASLGATALLTLTLFGCNKQEEAAPVKQAPNATAQSMLNSPNLTPEQKAKIQEGLKTHGGDAPANGTK